MRWLNLQQICSEQPIDMVYKPLISIQNRKFRDLFNPGDCPRRERSPMMPRLAAPSASATKPARRAAPATKRRPPKTEPAPAMRRPARARKPGFGYSRVR